MSNQICIKAQTQPGDELLCDVNCHLYNYEAGAPAMLAGVMCRTIAGDYGILDVGQLRGRYPASERAFRAATRLVCLENTHNLGGGRIYPIEKIQAISSSDEKAWSSPPFGRGCPWNAVVATGISAARWAQYFDTVSVCLVKGWEARGLRAGRSQGVGDPSARFIRKRLGGGMRQAGVLAAAALYALDNHIDRLKEDHHHAQILAQAIEETPGLRLDLPKVDTN